MEEEERVLVGSTSKPVKIETTDDSPLFSLPPELLVIITEKLHITDVVALMIT